MASQVKWLTALILYLLFIASTSVFDILPGLEAGSPRTTLVRAVPFELVAHAGVDLANLATLKD